MVELLLSLLERETSGLRLRPVPELSSKTGLPILGEQRRPRERFRALQKIVGLWTAP